MTTDPDLADTLGRTDLDFENFYFFDFFGPQISGLGPAWAHPLGPRVGPPTWAPRGPTHLGPSGGPLGHCSFMAERECGGTVLDLVYVHEHIRFCICFNRSLDFGQL